METIPTTSRSLDRYYHINGDTFEKQYKEVLSGYREWSELSHAEDWLVFPENIGESICIDETAPSNGELYTISGTGRPPNETGPAGDFIAGGFFAGKRSVGNRATRVLNAPLCRPGTPPPPGASARSGRKGHPKVHSCGTAPPGTPP